MRLIQLQKSHLLKNWHKKINEIFNLQKLLWCSILSSFICAQWKMAVRLPKLLIRLGINILLTQRITMQFVKNLESFIFITNQQIHLRNKQIVGKNLKRQCKNTKKYLLMNLLNKYGKEIQNAIVVGAVVQMDALDKTVKIVKAND